MSQRERVTGLPLNGRELQALRINQRKGTQKEVARALGVAEKTVQNWENGGAERSKVDVRLNHVAKVADFYGVPQEQIIAKGYAPSAPIRTVEEALDGLRQQLLELAGEIGRVGAGVQALVLHAGVTPASRGSRPRKKRPPGDAQVG